MSGDNHNQPVRRMSDDEARMFVAPPAQETWTEVSGPNHNQADAVARVAWEVEHNPNGPIAQAVRQATAAADRFGREFAALEREVRGEVSVVSGDPPCPCGDRTCGRDGW